MRFNPPPNWPPVPPGWTPPPGWSPDPSWPPLPPGWALWVPDGPQRSNKGLIIGGAVAAALVAIAVVVALVMFTNRSSHVVTSGSTTTTTTKEKSDEDQVRDLVDTFEQAWNDEDYDALRDQLCKDVRSEEAYSKTELRNVRESEGRLKLTINSVDVTGDDATANVENHGEGAQDITFAREAGEWKWCEP